MNNKTWLTITTTYTILLFIYGMTILHKPFADFTIIDTILTIIFAPLPSAPIFYGIMLIKEPKEAKQ